MQSSNMSGTPHLTAERLAAFDDEPFSADELAHLSACATCRAEHEAMATVVSLAGALAREMPPADAPRLAEFDAILAGMKGVEHAAAVPASTASHRPRQRTGALPTFLPWLRQAAAVLLLVGGGAVLGRMGGEVSASRGESAGAVAEPLRASASPASLSPRPFADLSYGSVEQATIALNEAQREYERASLWLASNDSTIRDPEVFRARLAALDQMMEASRVALRDAPQDPVLNHYYLAAYSAREATLQALSSALPVDKIIERY